MITENALSEQRARALSDALERISQLRPSGDVERCKEPRKLVEQMERIALQALRKFPSSSRATES